MKTTAFARGWHVPFLFVLILLLPNSAKAIRFDDALEHGFDVVTDPWGLRDISSSARYSASQVRVATENIKQAVVEARAAIADLDRLEGRVKRHAEERLNQLAALIEGAKMGTLEVIEQATSDIRELEQQVVVDINKIVLNTECAAMRALKDVVDNGIRNIKFISENKREITLPFGAKKPPRWKFWKSEEPVVFILDLERYREPASAYEEIVKATLDNLDLAEEDASTYKVATTYEGLSRLARNTQCFYMNQAIAEFFQSQATYYTYLAAPWVKRLPSDGGF